MNLSKHKKEKQQEDNYKNTESDEIKSEKADAENSDSETVDEENSKTANLELQVNELQDKLLRKAAEFENYKRRTENDQFNLINYAAESFITKLLPIVDDFERSMSHIDEIENSKSVKDGIKLVYEKLQKLLQEQGIKKMQTKGESFNVEYHDALMQRKDDSVPPHTVLEEIESGYIYRDKVIRHAKVIVSEDVTTDENQVSNENGSESISGNEK